MSPTDDDVEQAILTELLGAGPSAALCASCLVAALEVDQQRLMDAIRALTVRGRRLIDVQGRRCTRCGEATLTVYLLGG